MEEALVVPGTVEQLDAFHNAMDHFWQAVDRADTPRPTAHTRMAFRLGVAEIATNIVRHAYAPPRAIGQIDVRLRLYPGRLEAVLMDWGGPFLEPVVVPESLPADVPEHGLGLGVARRTLDRVVYTRTKSGVNRWQLMKRF